MKSSLVRQQRKNFFHPSCFNNLASRCTHSLNFGDMTGKGVALPLTNPCGLASKSGAAGCTGLLMLLMLPPQLGSGASSTAEGQKGRASTLSFNHLATVLFLAMDFCMSSRKRIALSFYYLCFSFAWRVFSCRRLALTVAVYTLRTLSLSARAVQPDSLWRSGTGDPFASRRKNRARQDLTTAFQPAGYPPKVQLPHH